MTEAAIGRRHPKMGGAAERGRMGWTIGGVEVGCVDGQDCKPGGKQHVWKTTETVASLRA